jgi:Fe-S-cluster containining protein
MPAQNKGVLDCDIKLCHSLCCRNCPVLTETEVTELMQNVKKNYGLELEIKKYFRRAEGEFGIYFAMKLIRGVCIFLNKEKRCRIYRCRPTLCKLYPVVDVDSVDMRCPGVSENKIPASLLDILKQRYADEIDEKIKMEQIFRFV